MSQARHLALVVDHDVAIRERTSAALAEHGFDSDIATNRDQAHEKLAARGYDAVIVDLQLPNGQGQSLVEELLQREQRPLIIICSDAIDPNVAKELIHRGVDGVLTKPFDLSELASKVQSLVEQRHRRRAHVAAAVPTAHDGRMTTSEFKEKLGEVSHVLPISAAALDVYQMTQDLNWDLSQIAAAVQRDPALATEVLRMANSSYYNPPGRPIVDMDEAVMRIGQKRTGELALSINALANVTPTKIPWMDLELSWNRCMAAGIALELLVDMGGHEEIAEGLFVSAIMHPLGRIVLGMKFPQVYAELVAECSRTGSTLLEMERRTFPGSHTDVMAQLLADWHLAPEVFIPLKFSSDDYPLIGRLLEPMRTKAELVKVAILLGRLAVGRWESWDSVQFPPASVLDRLRVRDVESIVRQTRSDLLQLAEFHPDGMRASKKTVRCLVQRRVAYRNYSGHGADLVKEFLPALGLQVVACSSGDLRQFEEPLIANCLGIEPPQLASQRTSNLAVILAEQKKCETFACYATPVGLPNSFGVLRETVLAHVAESAPEPVAGAV